MTTAWCQACGARHSAALAPTFTCGSCGHVWRPTPSRAKPRGPAESLEHFVRTELADLGLDAAEIDPRVLGRRS